MSRVVVVAYDAGWAEQFRVIEADLQAALVQVPLVGIEHVGSTSVVGLAAKPIIDIDVIVDRPSVDAAIQALESAGYAYQGDLGIEDRHWMKEPDGPRRNVYVTVDGCLSVRNHLAVRDALRTHTDLRDRYGTLKLELSERDWEDSDGYTEAKSVLLQEILEVAGLTWADRAAIDADNTADSSGG